MTASTEHGERLARLEGAYKQLATKADIEGLKSWFMWRMLLGMVIMQGMFVVLIKYLP